MASGDDYTAKYMEGGAALIATRRRMPWWFFALMAVPALVTIVPLFLAPGGLVPALIALPVLAVITLLFSHLRLVVTSSHVHVQLGIFGPKVSIASITSVAAEAYDWKSYGGWGMRARRLGGKEGSDWAYSIPGGDGRGVRLAYIDDKGRPKQMFISTDDADGVVVAIEGARAALVMGSGVRVDAGAGTTTGVRADAGAAGAARAAARGEEAAKGDEAAAAPGVSHERIKK